MNVEVASHPETDHATCWCRHDRDSHSFWVPHAAFRWTPGRPIARFLPATDEELAA